MTTDSPSQVTTPRSHHISPLHISLKLEVEKMKLFTNVQFTELHAYVNDLEKMVKENKITGEENVAEAQKIIGGARGILVLGENVELKLEKVNE